jgi:hypothetical protein
LFIAKKHGRKKYGLFVTFIFEIRSNLKKVETVTEEKGTQEARGGATFCFYCAWEIGMFDFLVRGGVSMRKPP